jgi:DNA-binding response OmpR family regulator
MRVLVIDDEERLARALGRGLEDQGFSTALAFDGDTGYQLGATGRFDAIVLDLMLPGLSGTEVCRRLRAARIWTPIIVLTARDGEEDETRALDLGADDYLRKPFSYRVLVARLHALLRRGPADGPAELAVGDLVLDLTGRTVRRGEVVVALSRREFALLEHLARNAGRTVSKTEILQQVWAGGRSHDPNVVEVYMGYLRRKVGEPLALAGLSTVRGEGYRLDVSS